MWFLIKIIDFGGSDFALGEDMAPDTCRGSFPLHNIAETYYPYRFKYVATMTACLRRYNNVPDGPNKIPLSLPVPGVPRLANSAVFCLTHQNPFYTFVNMLALFLQLQTCTGTQFLQYYERATLCGEYFVPYPTVGRKSTSQNRRF